MAVEAHSTVEQLEVCECNPCVEDVFVNVVARAGVDEKHVVLNVAVWQSSQPRDSVLADGVNCPPNHGGSIVVEPLEDLRIRAGTVVVTDKGEPPSPRDLVDAALGIAPIADDVTEAQDLVGRRAVT
jgi:hypothetical protein